MVSLESIGIIISILSVVIAFAILIGNKVKDSGKQDAHNASVVTKLEFISEDVKDVKADQRTFQSQINDIRNLAVDANSKAEAAHRRLDKAGIDVVVGGTD